MMMSQTAGARSAEIKLLSSNGISTVLKELVPQFERTTGHKVTIAYDTGNLVAKRVQGGEAADLVIVPTTAFDALTQEGKVVPATRKLLASSSIGVAVRAGLPKPDIGSAGALKKALLETKSIVYTGTGASGIHFAQVIERLGIAEQVKAKAKIPAGGHVGELLVKGEADTAVQQIPELMAVKGIDLVGPLPAEFQLTTTLAGGLCQGAKEPHAAQALLDLLSAVSSAAVYKANGLDPAN